MRIEDGFQQIPFEDSNVYSNASLLSALLRRTMPQSVYHAVHEDLLRLGGLVRDTVRPLSAQIYPPKLVQYDQWGRRVDDLQTSEGWRKLKAISQTEGLPAIFYERTYGEHSRAYGFAKALLMAGDSQVVFCPISMTDGAARIIELQGSAILKEEILPRLVSREPLTAFTSGQWMTERPGGSDVSQTETTAESTGHADRFGPIYELDGFKWFSSATDSNISLALARTGDKQLGSKGLSLFLVPLRLPLIQEPGSPTPSSTSNNVFVHRLKNKIGTQIVPTAELSLERSQAHLIGGLNQGVKNISSILNITRLWSAVGSTGYLARCLQIATSYAQVRAINGGKTLLKDSHIHVSQLASISLIYRALLHLTFGAVRLMGKVECNVATPEEDRRLRALTPVVKAFAAEKACAAMEEAMTALGGAGYMEENGLGRLIRDGLVEKIWEGTTTVLSLDLLRSTQNVGVRSEITAWARGIVSSCPSELSNRLSSAIRTLSEAINLFQTAHELPFTELLVRPILFLTGYLASSIFLLEHAIWSFSTDQPEKDTDIEVVRRWILEGGLIASMHDAQVAKDSTAERAKLSLDIVFGVGNNDAKSKL